MTTVKLRFNTENKTDQYWRVLVNGEERTARSVAINVPTFTTQDNLPNGKVKFHITCFDPKVVTWKGDDVEIN